MDNAEVERLVGPLLAAQDGVVSRRQLVECGLEPHDIKRMLRRNEWSRVLPGVFVDHTGVPSWVQRAWAGVLHLWPAALAGASAVRAVQGPGWRGFDMSAGDLLGDARQSRRTTAARRRGAAADDIEVVVDADRNPAPIEGYAVIRCRAFQERVQWNASPPRIRFEEAVLDLAAGAPSDLAAVALLGDACQSRRTTADRLLRGLDDRRRMSRRGWLVDVLHDVADGTCSALEHAYLGNVERPHGLPRGERQVRETVGDRVMFRDVLHRRFGLVVELDGRLYHDSARRRDADLERDLDVAVAGRDSIRLGWGQCTDRACATAARLAKLLQLRGWTGQPTPCGPDCVVGAG